MLCFISRYSYGTEVVDEGPLTVGSFKADNGDVVSHLNITQARTKYGGIYDCVASSKVGSVTHTGKLNIFGAPFIRKMEAMKVVAGKSMSITCPVAGYPVSRIVWERGKGSFINDVTQVGGRWRGLVILYCMMNEKQFCSILIY